MALYGTKYYGFLLMVLYLQGVSAFEPSQYLGCFNDDRPRALEHEVTIINTTIDKCIRECKRLNYTFAGLQYYYICFCGNEYDKYGSAKENDCNLKCRGDESQVCGGNWVNSVYSVCVPGYYGDTCNRQCISYTCQPEICRFDNGGCLYEECDPRHSYCKKNCHTLKVDPRDEVGKLNSDPVVYYLFVFSELTFSTSGTISEIKFFAARAGSVYVSFWRKVKNNIWMMVGKILVQSTGYGAQTMVVPHSTTVYVQAGDVPGIHYTDGSDGVIYYEDQSETRTNGVRLSDLKKTYRKYVQDDNWVQGHRITFYSNDRRTAAIHISLDCITDCPPHCAEGLCDRESGHCEACEPGYYGVQCEHECPPNCRERLCDSTSGHCTVCKTGYRGDTCDRECEDGFYGNGCTTECSPYCKHTNIPCNKFSNEGECHEHLCKPGYIDKNCKTPCTDGFYGDNCTGVCMAHCLNPPCVKESIDGQCTDNQCDVGYQSPGCVEECSPGFYGVNCEGICSDYCQFPPCIASSVSGMCPQKACVDGYHGDNCQASPVSEGFTVPLIAAVVVCGLATIILVPVAIYCILKSRRMRRRKMSEETKMVDIKQSTLSLEYEEIPNDVTSQDKNPDESALYSNDFVSPTAVKVKDLTSRIAQMKTSQNHGFQEEFERLPKITSSTSEAGVSELRTKNRYKNILPYDTNRVLLTMEDGDILSQYINASYVKDYDEKVGYIAALAPTNITLVDFWRLIWEHDIHTVFMLTELVEQGKMKCEQYWPVDREAKYGDISVLKKRESPGSEFVTRTLEAKKGEGMRTITQYQYTVWPDKSVPDRVGGMLQLREILRHCRKREPDTMVLVHCSAGVGRSGTFIALDILLEQAHNRSFVDVFECVKKLRGQRVHMVQTQVQYEFLYTALNEILTLGQTRIVCSELAARMDEMATQYTEQYNFLETERIQKNQDIENGGDKVSKMTDNDDETTTGLSSDIKTHLVRGYTPVLRYLVTQIPSADQSTGFWDLVCTEKISQIVCLEETDSQWLPTEGCPIQTERHQVRCETKSHDEGIEVREIKLALTGDVYMNVADMTQEHHVKVLKVPNQGDLTSQEIIALHKASRSTRRQGSSSPVLVLCRDGVTRCGVYLASCQLMDMADTEQQVEVFYIVRKIRKVRSEFIMSLEQYIHLHKILKDYIQEFDDYANFK